MADGMEDRRKDDPRTTTSVPGVIKAKTLDRPIPCLVRNVSISGAEIEVAAPSEIPDVLTLVVDAAEMRIRCYVAWRKGTRVGLAFQQ